MDEGHTSVDPVKATLSTSLWRAMAAPAVGPYPGSTLITPAGNPACGRNGNVSVREEENGRFLRNGGIF